MHLFIRLTLLCALCMTIASPTTSFFAAIDALTLCAGVLIPAIVPTLLLYEWLRGYGILWRFASWCAPLMRSFLRIPGEGAIVLLVGFASGYPVAAKLAHDFVKDGTLSKDDASRLICCATTADPLFIVSVIASNVYGDARVASMLLLAHYGGALLYALYTRPHTVSPARPQYTPPNTVFHMPHSVRTIASLLSIIVGLVVLIHVVLVLTAQTTPIRTLAQLMAVHTPHVYTIATPLIISACEVSLGQVAIAHMPAARAFPLASFALAWGGLAVHAQVMAIATTHIVSYRTFVCARLAHGLFAAVLTTSYYVLFMR